MKIVIKAKPGAKVNKIEKTGPRSYEVFVTALPIEGRANAAIVKLLAEHFDMSPSLVEIISGHMARTKVVELHTE